MIDETGKRGRLQARTYALINVAGAETPDGEVLTDLDRTLPALLGLPLPQRSDRPVGSGEYAPSLSAG